MHHRRRSPPIRHRNRLASPLIYPQWSLRLLQLYFQPVNQARGLLLNHLFNLIQFLRHSRRGHHPDPRRSHQDFQVVYPLRNQHYVLHLSPVAGLPHSLHSNQIHFLHLSPRTLHRIPHLIQQIQLWVRLPSQHRLQVYPLIFLFRLRKNLRARQNWCHYYLCFYSYRF